LISPSLTRKNKFYLGEQKTPLTQNDVPDKDAIVLDMVAGNKNW